MSQKEQKLLDRLQNKYRLVIMNDDTLEEQVTFRLSQLNVYALISSVILVLTLLIVLLIIFTPLKIYIPGYGDTGMRRNAINLNHNVDSLQEVVAKQNAYLVNLRHILTDSIAIVSQSNVRNDSIVVVESQEDNQLAMDTINLTEISQQELSLRAEVEQVENYALFNSKKAKNKKKSKGDDFYFFPPIKGTINDGFDTNKEHFGVDILANENEPIKAIGDGIVIFNAWTLDDGYVIAIQHANNLVSFYKHNSVLLKKVGNFVKAGDVIAIIGDSGEKSTGPHLHFELWHEQLPIDPSKYLKM